MIHTSKLLHLFDGNEHLVSQYVVLVKKEIPRELEELKAFLNANNFKDASIVAHSIKGQCDYLDLNECAEIAFKIETIANKNSFKNDKFSLYNQLKENLSNALAI